MNREAIKEYLKAGVYLSLEHLSQLFHLSPFEELFVLICLAPELHSKYEKLYAYLQDDITRKKPSIGLVLRLLCRTAEENLTARLSFNHEAPLIWYELLQFSNSSPGENSPLISRPLKLDDRIVNFLLGSGSIDSRLESIISFYNSGDDFKDQLLACQSAGRLINFVQKHFSGVNDSFSQNLIVYLHGLYGAGRHTLAGLICSETGFPILTANTEKMLESSLPFEKIVRLLGREALLQQAALCLENFDSLFKDAEKNNLKLECISEMCQVFLKLTFLLGSQPWTPVGSFYKNTFINLELPFPDDEYNRNAWESSLEKHSTADCLDVKELAGKFIFTPGQVRDAFNMARNLAYWNSGDPAITVGDLYTACRRQSNNKLDELALKIPSKYTWEDIFLPGDQIELLHEICKQVKHRHTVLNEWGFNRKLSRGKGVSVLFYGTPGTGKTMAAEVLANELDLDLFKIDLAQVVSKYVGETEKNLKSVFAEAKFSNSILLFDEADALFGKRSEVKDAHDRYANIEVAYLLQKMEEYDGIAILAANMRANLDEAFIRRLQFAVEFPFPNEEFREKIWLGMFPAEAPKGSDIDVPFLARNFKITGGNIKNIVLTAAFFAVEKRSAIDMEHLILATKRELQKIGKLFVKEDFGQYYGLIADDRRQTG
ncbi:MAG: AAA family ATPase [Eubacteriales bacterium]